jgi:hypothetical protein
MNTDFELPRDDDALLTRQEMMRLLRLKKTAFTEMQEAGEIPQPTLYLRTSPRWRVGDFRRWIQSGGILGTPASIPSLKEDPKKPEKARKHSD